jgi:hypothetical protein
MDASRFVDSNLYPGKANYKQNVGIIVSRAFLRPRSGPLKV